MKGGEGTEEETRKGGGCVMAFGEMDGRPCYNVRYSGKLWNRFRLHKSMSGWYARSDSTDRVYERTQTQSTQAWLTEVYEVSD